MLNMRCQIANEVCNAKLAITISYSTSMSGVIVLSKIPKVGEDRGGLKLLPPVPFILDSGPLLQRFPPLCSISIVKCYAILLNFSPFLLVPITLGIPLPALYPPVPLPPPILMGSYHPVPLHPEGIPQNQLQFVKNALTPNMLVVNGI